MEPQALDLPVKSWRSGQTELLAQLATSEKKYICLQAPTGVGKSLLAISLRRLSQSRTLVLTGTKALQDQYLDDFGPSGMLKAIGRSNFVCNRDHKYRADAAPCTWGDQCLKKSTPDCDYYAQKIKAQNGQEVVLNYPFFLAQTNYAKAFRDFELIICDEAHTLEEEIRKFVTKEISHSTLSMAKLLCSEHPKELESWAEWAALVSTRVYKTYDGLTDPRTKQRFGRLIDTLDWLAAQQGLGDDNWVVVETKYGYEFRPVWVDKLAQDVFFRHVPRGLFMSATLLDPGMFCAHLGLSDSDVEFIAVPSTFPRERRPLIYAPVGKVTAKNDATLDKLVAKVKEILTKHSGRGLIHTSNYKVAKHLMEHCNEARLFTHDTKSRGEAINFLRNSPGRVLVSPSMGTGVDLPYELCEFQIIAKLPFPDMGDPQVARRMRKGPDGKPSPKGSNWYNNATVAALVQMYGRGMRATDDHCTTYLLDGVWGWFGPATRHIQPDWFMEAFRRERPADGPPEISVAERLKQIRSKNP